MKCAVLSRNISGAKMASVLSCSNRLSRRHVASDNPAPFLPDARPAEPRRPSGNFHCRHCPFASDEKSLVRWHENKHQKDRPLVCLVCKKSFLWRSSMAAHLRSHTGVQPYNCSICSRGFSSTTNLARHAKRCGMMRDAESRKTGDADETPAEEADPTDPKLNDGSTSDLNVSSDIVKFVLPF